MTKRFARLLLCLLAAVSVGACQTIADKRKIDYKATRTLPPLDIPPDLAAPEGAGDTKEGTPTPGAATYSGFVSGEGQTKARRQWRASGVRGAEAGTRRPDPLAGGQAAGGAALAAGA